MSRMFESCDIINDMKEITKILFHGAVLLRVIVIMFSITDIHEIVNTLWLTGLLVASVNVT